MTSPALWLQSHQKEAAGAAGVVVVAGLALFRSHHRAASAGGASSAPDPASSTAGLSGIPDTLATDIGNQTQDQLNAWYANIMGQVGKPPAGGATPATPKPHPVDPIPKLPRPPARPAPTPPRPAPTKPKPAPIPSKPKPAPKPEGWKYFTIPAGGSLAAAATKIYGHATSANVQQLATWNGIKLYQRNGTTYADVYPGQRIKYR